MEKIWKSLEKNWRNYESPLKLNKKSILWINFEKVKSHFH